MQEKLNELALFAGAGGGLLASKLLGWNTVGAVEIEPKPREMLMQRQRDGMLDQFPIWDDVRTFDGKPWRGLVDAVSGGFPCQDISAAGAGAGLAGSRSGLWFEYLRIVEEIRPRFVFAENSPNLRTRGLGEVIDGLTRLGYVGRNGVLGAWHIGANHKRNRMWIVAHANSVRELQPQGGEQAQRGWAGNGGQVMADANEIRRDGRASGETAIGSRPIESIGSADGGTPLAYPPSIRQQTKSDREINSQASTDGQTNLARNGGQVPDADCTGCQEQRRPIADGSQHPAIECGGWWESEPRVGRVAHGVANRVDRLKAIGNGQVPAVAAAAFEILKNSI